MLLIGLLVLLAGTATWTSVALMLRHVAHGKSGQRFFDLVCGEGGGCDAVLQSEWAYVGNIPLAAFGVAYFGMLTVWWLIVGGGNARGRRWHVPSILLTFGAVLLSLSLLRIMYRDVGQVCGGCLIVHLINLMLLVLSVLLWRRLAAIPGETPRPSPRLGFAGLMLMLLVGLATFFWTAAMVVGGQARVAAEYVQRYLRDPGVLRYLYEREPHHEIALSQDEPVLGTADASHTAVVFSDFSCPHCAALAGRLRQMAELTHRGRLRVVFRHYPNDPACNTRSAWQTHFGSCEAARAAEAARLLGGNEAFWKMHDRLFDLQKRLRQRKWSEWAGQAGLNGAGLVALMTDKRCDDRVKRDIEQAAALGVTRTPAVFLDGRKITGWESKELWELLLGAAEPGTEGATSGDEAAADTSASESPDP